MITVEMLKPLLQPTGGFIAIILLALLLKKPKKVVKSSAQSKNDSWSLDLLMSLEWKRYEEICKEFLIIKEKGRLNVSVTKTGADGGIDLKITDKKNKIVALGQCKAYNSIIGVSFIRELFGVMASEKVGTGYFFTTSKFSNDAIEFANKNKITLINGSEQIKIIQSFKPEQQQKLFQIATNGDYTTPTCPSCDIKLIKRSSEKGEFWGCPNYPRCKTKLNIRKKSEQENSKKSEQENRNRTRREQEENNAFFKS